MRRLLDGFSALPAYRNIADRVSAAVGFDCIDGNAHKCGYPLIAHSVFPKFIDLDDFIPYHDRTPFRGRYPSQVGHGNGGSKPLRKKMPTE